MDEEKRSNQNYEIIESCTIGSTELVIGHNPNSPNPYVCWYCKGGSNYFWGYYTNELDDARQKLNERYQSECRMPYNQPARSRKTVMTVSDKIKYDCTTCPYPRYKDGSVIFCDVCIRKILDEQKEKKERKEQPNE
mgnify:FL=1